MASKINPKGIFKSNSRSKGPNPKGINPGGINNKPASKPVTNTTTPRTRAGVTKGTTPGTGNKYSSKTPINTNTSVSQGRGGVSKGGSQGTANKYANKSNTTAALKARADARIAAEKATKERITKSPRVTAQQRLGDKKPTMSAAERRVVKTAEAQAKKAKAARAIKIAKVTKVAKVAGKGAAIVGTIAGLTYGAKKLYDSSTGKKDSGKKPEKTNTLIKTPSLKDELKKRGVTTPNKSDELKYVINKPKADAKKDASKKGSLPKAIDKAVKAIDGNQPGDGSSLKFTGDRSKVAGKDKWGRSPSDKWYGFNPDSKKYETPTMVKGDNKKSDTKVETKKPATTPKVTTPKATTPAVKKAEPVGTLAPKSTQTIASKSLEEAKTVTPAKTTTPAITTTSTESSTSTTSPKVTGMQPRATIGNKIRGMLNESRERRAGRAASRGNESRAEKLEEKISATEKKMMMKKGGIVKSKTKKK